MPNLELAPCPFCGASAFISWDGDVNSPEDWSANCDNTLDCGASVGGMNSEATAIAAWNSRIPAPIVAPEVDEALIRLLLDWRKWYSEDIFSPWTIEEAQAVHAQFPDAADRIAAASARGTIDRIVEDIQEGKHAAPASTVAPQQSDEARVTQERDDLSNEMSRCHEMLARFDGTYEEGMVCADTLEECLQRHLDALTPVITDDTVNGDD